MTHTPVSTPKKIRVGLLGAGTWALMGHLPALRKLPAYELSIVYARNKEIAKKAATEQGFRFVAETVEDLVNHPEVDLVIVASPAPQHADHVRAALNAGKDVYCEWPLTTSTAIAAELVELARRKGVRHMVGLQRRLAPHNRYLQDLLAQGFVGKLRSVRIHVSIKYLGAARTRRTAWTFPVENFSNVVTIYTGHFLDMLFKVTGWPTAISALQLNQFPVVTIEETGERVSATSLDQLVLLGRLGEAGTLSAHIEGGKHNGFGVQIDITGEDGDLRVTNPDAFVVDDSGSNYRIEGAKSGDHAMQTMPVPASYDWLLDSGLPSAVAELGQLYAAFSKDVSEGTHVAPNFEDALRMHKFFDAIKRSTETGVQQAVYACTLL